MPNAVCIKAGGVDDKAVRDFKKTGVEFYCKDRVGYSKAVEGAEQKPVSLVLVFCFVIIDYLLGGEEEKGGGRWGWRGGEGSGLRWVGLPWEGKGWHGRVSLHVRAS